MKDIFNSIKKCINAISFLQLRESALRDELEYVIRDFSPQDVQIHPGAIFRLEHEITSLCEDTYSLAQGIFKEKSLYSTVIKQSGQKLTKIDKTPRTEVEIIDCEHFDSQDHRDSTEEELQAIARICPEQEIKARTNIRDSKGITSGNHEQLDIWKDGIIDPDIISCLHKYHKKGAHRFDSLESIDEEFKLREFTVLKNQLDTVSTVLEGYKNAFQAILIYTNGEIYVCFGGFKYDSISRIRQCKDFSQFRINQTESSFRPGCQKQGSTENH